MSIIYVLGIFDFLLYLLSNLELFDFVFSKMLSIQNLSPSSLSKFSLASPFVIFNVAYLSIAFML